MAITLRTTQEPSRAVSLPVRYNPYHHDVVVPDAEEDMPETGPQVQDDLK